MRCSANVCQVLLKGTPPRRAETPARCATAASTSIRATRCVPRRRESTPFREMHVWEGYGGDKHAKSLGINEMKPEHPSTSAKTAALEGSVRHGERVKQEAPLSGVWGEVCHSC